MAKRNKNDYKEKNLVRAFGKHGSLTCTCQPASCLADDMTQMKHFFYNGLVILCITRLFY